MLCPIIIDVLHIDIAISNEIDLRTFGSHIFTTLQSSIITYNMMFS